MTLLLTGASGHVGANLLRRLLVEQEDVRVMVRASTKRQAFADLPGLTFVEADLRDADAVGRAVADCERVYHCAAKVQTVVGGERDLYDTNVLGTRNVLRAAKQHHVKRVVVTSSLGAVGHPGDRPCNEDDGFYPFAHHMPYEASKAWVEHECLQAATEGLQVVMVVSTAVLGPNDYGPSRMGRVIRDFANRKLNAYLPGGFEFVAASDLVHGHLLAMRQGRSGQRYIVSSDFLTVDALMDMLARITGVPKPRLRLPPTVMMGIAHLTTALLRRAAPTRPLRFTPDAVRLLQMQRRADIGKAKRELGYTPTAIESAVLAAYEWFVAHGQIEKEQNDHASRTAGLRQRQKSPPEASRSRAEP